MPSGEGQFSALLKRYGNAPYHLCYVTDNMQKAIEHLKIFEYRVIVPPAKAVAINNNLVAFLMNPYIGMVELLEVCDTTVGE